MHLTVVLRDAQSNVLTGRIITFASSSGTRMSVDASGIVTGIGSSGHSDVSATSEGVTDKVRIASEPSVATMNVSGPTNSVRDLIIARGSSTRFTVTLEDASGRGVPGQVVSVTSSDASVVSPSKTSLTTNRSGSEKLDLIAGTSAGLALVTFRVSRAGAIPPGTPGHNDVTVTLPIVVP
jgi:hypothetical protein